MKDQLSSNLTSIKGRISDACARSGRRDEDVKLIAVTKSASMEAIRHLVELGVEELAENQVQQMTKRAGMLQESLSRFSTRTGENSAKPRWHMIGHLQRNKVQAVLPWAALIHSLDSLRLAEEIDAQAAKQGVVAPVLLQVNISKEMQKFGIAVAAALPLLEQIASLPNLEIQGMMGMAPFTNDEDVIRRTFSRGKELFDEIRSEKIGGPAFRELSMGMSNDFEFAVEFGATMVRVGSALFEGVEPNGETSPITDATAMAPE
ncbi:MAG: YggS family pyridoxal phosphate-dependent enzyme [Phycisphaerae bacterium]